MKCYEFDPEVAWARAILPSLLCADMMRAMMDDEQSTRISPRRIAVLACDITVAFLEECKAREWMREARPSKEGE